MLLSFLTGNVEVLSQDNIKIISYATKPKHFHNYFNFQLYKLGGLKISLKVSFRFPGKTWERKGASGESFVCLGLIKTEHQEGQCDELSSLT